METGRFLAANRLDKLGWSMNAVAMTSKTLSVWLCVLCLASQALAQQYPHKPIRLVVPNPAGGGVDILARAIGQPLSEKLGQSVVVENRPGAGGTIGLGLVAKSAPDGYTLGMGVDATLAIAPAVYRSLPYDPIKDFAPITLIATLPLVVVVHPSLPVKSVRDLIALAKAEPGQIDYSSGGNGTPPHLAAEVFKAMAKVQMNHVPYKGGPPAITAVVAGEVSLMFANMLPGLPHIRSGRLRALAVTSERRSSVLPGVPTIKESGLPSYHVTQWYGVVAPFGTPAAIITLLNREVRQILELADVRARLQAEGAELSGTTPEEFSDFIRQEIAKWAKAVKDSGTRLD